MDILISILVGVSLIEIYVWLPALSDWLTEKAVRRLNRADQERYREDWRANLARLPNSGLRLIHAFSLFFCARTINIDACEEFCDMAEHLIGDIVETHALYAHKNSEKAERQEGLRAGMKAVQQKTDMFIESARKVIPTDDERTRHLRSLRDCSRIAAERFHEAETLSAEYDGRVSARVDRLAGFLRTIEREHVPAIRRLRRGKLPPTDLTVRFNKFFADFDAFFDKEKEAGDEVDEVLEQFTASVNSTGEAIDHFCAVVSELKSLFVVDSKL